MAHPLNALAKADRRDLTQAAPAAGESAAHHRPLKRATKPHQETAKAALINVADHDEIEIYR